MAAAPDTVSARFFFDGTVLRENACVSIDVDSRVASIDFSSSNHDHFLVSTGLVDLQMNGYDEVDVADATHDELAGLCDRLRLAGTFQFLATLVSAPLDVMLRRSQFVSEFVRSSGHDSLVGIHLEGPFLGNAHGAHSSRDIVDADVSWIDSLPPEIRMMTIAPENPSCSQTIRVLRERGIIASLGHSAPTRQQFDDAVLAGASSVTHLFNAMSGVHHRDDGMSLWSMNDDRLHVGVIADGVHVSDSTGQLVGRAVDPDRRFLVSDSIAWNGAWAKKRGIDVRTGAPRLPSGTLAGSAATLAQCVAHAVRRWKWPLVDALRAATVVPARVAGIDPPHLTVGGPARLVCWNDELVVQRVLNGRTPEPR